MAVFLCCLPLLPLLVQRMYYAHYALLLAWLRVRWPMAGQRNDSDSANALGYVFGILPEALGGGETSRPKPCHLDFACSPCAFPTWKASLDGNVMHCNGQRVDNTLVAAEGPKHVYAILTHESTATLPESATTIPLVNGGPHILVAGDEGCFVASYGGSVVTMPFGEPPGFESLAVRLPMEVGIKEIACGAMHLAVVSKGGWAFTAGWNGHGQLGLSDVEPRELLEPVETLAPSSVFSVSCGHSHTVWLSSPGAIHAAGWNTAGQVSPHLRQQIVAYPVFIDLDGYVGATKVGSDDRASYFASDVSCGSRHTACLLSGQNFILSWGSNSHFQLGSAGLTSGPTVVTIPEAISGSSTASVTCSWASTFIRLAAPHGKHSGPSHIVRMPT